MIPPGAPNQFCASEHRETCLAAVWQLLAEREDRYPALIEAGKLKVKDATRGLERARCILAQWRWVTDRAAPPLPPFDMTTAGYFGAPDAELRSELIAVAARAKSRADHAPGDAGIDQLAAVHHALVWHQRAVDYTAGIIREVEQARLATAEWRASRSGRLAA